MDMVYMFNRYLVVPYWTLNPTRCGEASVAHATSRELRPSIVADTLPITAAVEHSMEALGRTFDRT